MPRQPRCADNLFLLGELLQGAGEYVTRSKHHAENEEPFMIELAREQIPHLKLALKDLERSLSELDTHLKRRLEAEGSGDDSSKKPDRRYRKASSGG